MLNKHVVCGSIEAKLALQCRDGGSGWAGWGHAHPDFGRIKGGAPHYYLTTQIFRPFTIPAMRILHIFGNMAFCRNEKKLSAKK